MAIIVTVRYDLDIESVTVPLHVEIDVGIAEDEFIINDFNAYYVDSKAPLGRKYQKVPYWLHKVLENGRAFEEPYYQELISQEVAAEEREYY